MQQVNFLMLTFQLRRDFKLHDSEENNNQTKWKKEKIYIDKAGRLGGRKRLMF